MSTAQVKQQFGENAAFYLTHAPHAQGKSLERLVTLTEPQPDWHVLDVATGGGHVAYTFAPHVARVWATDVTEEMLAQVRGEAAKRKFGNIRTAYAKAEMLPFEDASFDLVTCRIAPHHFDSISAFLAETARVLKPDGTLAIVDNVVPAGSVGDYVNAFERFRDPSHLRAWTVEEWQAALAQAGFAIAHGEELFKRMVLATWANRHDATMRAFLRSMLTEMTPGVAEFFDVQDAGSEKLSFRLAEALFVAKRTPAA
ncbi:MAG: methyltransferase domain-containing protein [Rhizobiales bacterium]|nr:methyltransferase domain-containing protein [Hyphomicrobiales bacterium]